MMIRERDGLRTVIAVDGCNFAFFGWCWVRV